MRLKLISVIFIALAIYGIFDIWNAYIALTVHAMNIDTSEVVIRSAVTILEIVIAIGLVLKKTWSRYLVYVVGIVITVLTIVAFLNASFNGYYVTLQHWVTAGGTLVLTLLVVAIIVYYTYVDLIKQKS